jgi:hypothetical protein
LLPFNPHIVLVPALSSSMILLATLLPFNPHIVPILALRLGP